MKFTIEKAALLAAMSAVASSFGKTSVPIINNVLIATNGQTVSFKTTNLDQEIASRVEANIVEAGMITVPAAQLFDIARNMNAGSQATFTFDGSDPRATVQSGRSRFKLPTLTAADFPSLPDVKGVSIRCGAAQLAGLLSDVAFCAGVEQTRIVFTATCLFVHLGKVAAATTNAKGFALSHLDNGAEIPPVLLAPKFVADAIRILQSAELDAELIVSEGRVKLIVDDVTIIAKTISESPLDYTTALDKANGKNIAKIEIAALQLALKRVGSMADGVDRPVRLQFSPGSLAVGAKAELVGEAQDEIEIEYDGPEVRMKLNGTLLSSILAHVGATHAEIRIGDAKAPIAIAANQEAETRYVLALQRG